MWTETESNNPIEKQLLKGICVCVCMYVGLGIPI